MIWTNKVQLFFLANTLLGENRKPHFNTRTLSKYQIQRFACLHTFNLTCFFLFIPDVVSLLSQVCTNLFLKERSNAGGGGGEGGGEGGDAGLAGYYI